MLSKQLENVMFVSAINKRMFYLQSPANIAYTRKSMGEYLNGFHIERLPVIQRKNFILVVVDKLKKFAHFLALKHPFTAQQVAQTLFTEVLKPYGVPQSIVVIGIKYSSVNFGKKISNYKVLH